MRGGKKSGTHPEEKFRSDRGGGKNERTKKKGGKKRGRAPCYKC